MSNENFTTLYSCSHTSGHGQETRSIDHPCPDCDNWNRITHELTQLSHALGYRSPTLPLGSALSSADLKANVLKAEQRLRALQTESGVQEAIGRSRRAQLFPSTRRP